MSFIEGLRIARGQIVWILALAVSTAVIVHLEQLDTEDRINARLLAAGVRAPDLPEGYADTLDGLLDELRAAGEVGPADPDRRAAHLIALSAAILSGRISSGAARAEVERVAVWPGEASPALRAARAQIALLYPDLADSGGNAEIAAR